MYVHVRAKKYTITQTNKMIMVNIREATLPIKNSIKDPKKKKRDELPITCPLKDTTKTKTKQTCSSHQTLVNWLLMQVCLHTQREGTNITPVNNFHQKQR